VHLRIVPSIGPAGTVDPLAVVDKVQSLAQPKESLDMVERVEQEVEPQHAEIAA